MMHMTEAERLKRVEDFQRNLFIVSGNAAFANSAKREADHIRLLAKAVSEPGWPLMRMYSDLGLAGNPGVAAKEKLLADGMAREHKLVRKGSGGQLLALEVLPRGLEIVRRMGLPVVELEGKGEFKHKVYVHRYLIPWAKKRKYRYWIERWFEPKQIDFVYEDQYQQLFAVEVCLSGSVEYNANAGVKCASLAGISQVVLACEDRKLIIGIKKMLSNEMMSVQNKIQVMSLGEFSCVDA